MMKNVIVVVFAVPSSLPLWPNGPQTYLPVRRTTLEQAGNTMGSRSSQRLSC